MTELVLNKLWLILGSQVRDFLNHLENQFDKQDAILELNKIVEAVSSEFFKFSEEKILAKNWSRFKDIPMRKSRPGSANEFNKKVIHFQNEYYEQLSSLAEKIRSKNSSNFNFPSLFDKTQKPKKDEQILNPKTSRNSPERRKKRIYSVSDWLQNCSSSSSFTSSN